MQIHPDEVLGTMLAGKKFKEVLTAKQEDQAALEPACGDPAALRNLANAARQIEGQPA